MLKPRAWIHPHPDKFKVLFETFESANEVERVRTAIEKVALRKKMPIRCDLRLLESFQNEVLE